MSEKRKGKKPNKQQREERRAHDANVFNEGFKMGFQMGLEQGKIDAEQKNQLVASGVGVRLNG
jgi:hypothetical protein